MILTLRADCMKYALAYRPFADALQDNTLHLGPMTREELQRAIEKPAEKLNVVFEAGLIERILDDIENEPGGLPLLEFALTLLWEQQARNVLTHSTYEALGQVKGALARYADEVYDDLNENEQKHLRRILVQLVHPGEKIKDTRRIANRKEFDESEWILIQRMADIRLVVTARDLTGEETVEIVHESLIHGWKQLREWINKDRSFRTWQERLRLAIQQWEGSGYDDGALLHGALLAQGEHWLENRPDDLNQDEQRYIYESVALKKREQARWKREQMLVSIGGGLVGGGFGGTLGTIADFISPEKSSQIGMLFGAILGNSLFNALFGSVIAFGISLGAMISVQQRRFSVAGGIGAGMLFGGLLGVFWANTENPAEILPKGLIGVFRTIGINTANPLVFILLGILLYAICGGGY